MLSVMRQITLCVIAILCTIILSCSRPIPQGIHSSPPTSVDDSIASTNYECQDLKTYSEEQRKQFYPFKQASKVMLISFSDSLSVPITKHKLLYEKVLELKVLSNKDVDTLTRIFYNIGPKPNDYWLAVKDPGANCYLPRNALCFLDHKGSVMDFIEICFECHRYETSSKRIRPIELCDNKYELLRTFFLSKGVRFGTKENNK